MQSITFLATTALLTAAISLPALAGDHGHSRKRDRQHTADTRPAPGFDDAMQQVPHSAAPDAPGYGWRYFSDWQAGRAVVISPQGDYYYNAGGQGLRWIAAEQI